MSWGRNKVSMICKEQKASVAGAEEQHKALSAGVDSATLF